MVGTYFLRGVLIGLIFGVPAGAIGALTIQRTLERGFLAGFVTGVGSSAADLLYACVGVFGIHVIFDFLTRHQAVIHICGGVFFLILGICICGRGKCGLSEISPASEGKAPGGTMAFYFASSFTAAMLNPATVLSFIVAFTAFGMDGRFSPGQGFGLILGILSGTLCWWLTLSGVTARLRKKVTGRIYRLLNRMLSGLMEGFGIFMVLQGVFGVL